MPEQGFQRRQMAATSTTGGGTVCGLGEHSSEAGSCDGGTSRRCFVAFVEE